MNSLQPAAARLPVLFWAVVGLWKATRLPLSPVNSKSYEHNVLKLQSYGGIPPGLLGLLWMS